MWASTAHYIRSAGSVRGKRTISQPLGRWPRPATSVPGPSTDVTSLKCDVRCSPESRRGSVPHGQANWVNSSALVQVGFSDSLGHWPISPPRSEEHTSELQSHLNLVCRLLLEKKKKYKIRMMHASS